MTNSNKKTAQKEVEKQSESGQTGIEKPKDFSSEASTGWNDGESDSDWSDRVEHGEYDPVTDEVYSR